MKTSMSVSLEKSSNLHSSTIFSSKEIAFGRSAAKCGGPAQRL